MHLKKKMFHFFLTVLRAAVYAAGLFSDSIVFGYEIISNLIFVGFSY